MNKLKLEELVIDSFDTTAAGDGANGTVFAEQQCTCHTNCTCPGCPSCDPSYCDTVCETCHHSCYGTCDYTCYNYPTCSWGTVCEA
jgi:hypothetical protein